MLLLRTKNFMFREMIFDPGRFIPSYKADDILEVKRIITSLNEYKAKIYDK